MNFFKRIVLMGCLAVGLACTAANEAEAGHYSGWQPRGSYYYSSYYYAPTRYHYVIYYPTAPRYIYYYNPYRRVYWGRYDLEGKPGQEYSLLADGDRKEKLSDIPESAFPKAGVMPAVPDSDGSARIETPPAPPQAGK